MGRLGFLALLALRGPVRLVLGLAGAVGLLGGLVILVLTLAHGGVLRGLLGATLVGVWFLAFWGRFEYDRAVVKRAPPDQAFHLMN